MPRYRAPFACLALLALLLCTCADDDLEPADLSSEAPPAPPADPASEIEDWPVIRDAKVSDHNETDNELPRGSVRLFLQSPRWFPDVFKFGPRLSEARNAILREALRRLLGDSDGIIRARAALALGLLNPPPLDSRTELLTALGDSSPLVVVEAIGALSRLGHEAAVAVPTLSRLLGPGNREVRIAAAQAMGRIGPAARDAVPRLVAMLGEGDAGLFNAAARGLAGLGGLAATAIPHLATGLCDVERSGTAAAALGAIGPAARATLPALRDAMGFAPGHAQVLAAWAIWRIGGNAASILPHLFPIVEGQSRIRPDVWPPVRWIERHDNEFRIRLERGATHFPTLAFRLSARSAALVLIGRIGAEARDLAPRLVGLLATADGREFEVIAWSLLRLGTGYSRPLVRELVRGNGRIGEDAMALLRASGGEGRRELIAELRTWPGPRGRVALRLLRELAGDAVLLEELAHGTEVSQVHIIRGWAHGGTSDTRFRRDVLRRLTDPAPAVRRAAALAVVPHPAAIHVLRRMLGAEVAEDRRKAAAALARYGPRAWPAVPELTIALADPVDAVRWEVADALANIGPDARAATRNLWNCLSDGNPFVAAAADRALQRIRAVRRHNGTRYPGTELR